MSIIALSRLWYCPECLSGLMSVDITPESSYIQCLECGWEGTKADLWELGECSCKELN
jgi:hypothetical protein